MSELENEVNVLYESIRERTNLLADAEHLPDRLYAFHAESTKQGEFDHSRYVLTGFFNIIELRGINLNIAHTATNYGYDYSKHKSASKLRRDQASISSDYINILKRVIDPKNLNEALAAQKLLAKLPIDTLDQKNYTEFQQLQHYVNSKVNLYNIQDQRLDVQTMIRANHDLQTQQADIISHQRRVEAFMTALEARAVTSDTAQQVNHEKLELLQALCVELGISLDEVSTTLSQWHDLHATDLALVLNYLKEDKLQKYDQAKQRQQEASYQGLHNASQLMIAVGQVTGNKTLSLIGGVALQSVAIAQSAQTLLEASASGLALLTPYTAIAMAALQLFSMFRSSNSDDINTFILKQIAQLSRQIDGLRKNLISMHQVLSQKVDYYFTSLSQQIDWLKQTLVPTIHLQFSLLRGDTEQLRIITLAGFESLLLKELLHLVSHVNDLETGCSSIDTLSIADAESMLRHLRDYAHRTSKNSLFTGSIYRNLIEHYEKYVNNLNEILKNNKEPEKLIGLIFLHAKYVLKTQSLRSIADTAIFNIDIFLTAVTTYEMLKRKLYGKVNYDPDSINNNNFIMQARTLIDFLLCLQQEKSIYLQLIIAIGVYFNDVQYAIANGVENYAATHNHDIHASFNDLVSMCDNKVPSDFGYEPYVIDPDLSKRQENIDFFKLGNIMALIKVNQYSIPSIFILAEMLGLGRFECHFIAPDNITKMRRTSEKNPKKYTMYPSQCGLELNFIFKSGALYRLYAPSKIKENKKFGPLRDLYAYAITKGTQQTYDELMIRQATNYVGAHWLTTKKEHVNRIAQLIAEPYAKLMNQVYWLQLYSHLVHFPEALNTAIDALHTRLTAQEDYMRYAESANLETIFPPTSELSHNDLETLGKSIISWIEDVGAKNALHNPLICQLELELQPTQDICLLSAAIAADKKAVVTVYSDNSFFPTLKPAASSGVLAHASFLMARL